MNRIPARWLLVFPAVVVFLWIGGIAAHQLIVVNMPKNDFQLRYVGCEAFYEGINPYGQEVLDRIEQASGEPGTFWYPAHLCTMLAPLWWLPYDTAASWWMLLALTTFLAAPVLYMRFLAGWNVPPWQVFALMLFTMLGFRYVMMTVVLGQFTWLVLLCVLAAAWLLMKRSLWLAVPLVLMTIRPDGAVIAAGFALIALVQRQWRPVLLSGALFMLFVVITNFMQAGWVLAFLQEIRNYNSVGGIWLPRTLGPLFGGLYLIATAGWTAYWLFRIRQRHDSGRLFVLEASTVVMTAVLLVIPHTNPYTLVYALPVLYFVFFHVHHQRLLSIGLLLTTLISWGLFLLALPIDQIVFPLLFAAFVTVVMLQRYGDVVKIQPAEPGLAAPTSG